MQRARARIATTPEVKAALGAVDESDLEMLLLGELQRASLEVIPGHHLADVVGPDRERVLETLVATMLDNLTRNETDGSSFALDGRPAATTTDLP